LKASGDLRNFFKTIVSLPNTYTGKLTVDINDIDEAVVARNLMLLLISFNFAPDVASLMMLHVWYSAFLPKNTIDDIKNKISPILVEFLLSGATELLEGKWTHNNNNDATLHAKLDRGDWIRVLGYCLGKSGISFGEANALRRSVLFEKSREDYKDRHSFMLPPPWRLAKLRFREYGILVPFSASCEEFNVPNPSV
jgi:hypothetical protein